MASDFSTLQQMVKQAREKLPRGDWDYLVGGADTETSLKRNRLAFDRLALKARVMNDVSRVQLGRSLLGLNQRIPVLLAPIGSLQVFDAGGGLSAGLAAGEFGIFQILSSVCQPDFETLARESAHAKIYQLYAHGDEAWVMDIIGRAQNAGYRAFCLTVDTQVYSRRERDLLKGYLPLASRRPGFMPGQPREATLQASLSWDLVKRIKLSLIHI